MARSKPRFRSAKITGSCPAVQEVDKDLKEFAAKVATEEPRFPITNKNLFYQNPHEEYSEAAGSYNSEDSSFGFQIENLEPTVFSIDVPSMGDQIDEYQSGGNMSSGQPEDSEPNEDSTSFEIRKINIAETVMSWLDNYGQARGYTVGSHGTSLVIHPDDGSRIDSGNSGSGDVDVDEEVTSNSKNNKIGENMEEPGAGRVSESEKENPVKPPQSPHHVETACQLLRSFHKDLEPLKTAKTHGIHWPNIQRVLSIWSNFMSTVWKRSQEGNISVSELLSHSHLNESLESLTLSVSPVDVSMFSNPIVRKNLSRIQEFLNLALKSSKEFTVIANSEVTNNKSSSSSLESRRIISPNTHEKLQLITKSCAKLLLQSDVKYAISPMYELLLLDVTPSKTPAGWMFFGKVELRYIENNTAQLNRQINIEPEDSGLRIRFLGSTTQRMSSADYGAIFHIVNRACQEGCEYYDNLAQDITEARGYLNTPLIPISYVKQFDAISPRRQYLILDQIIEHIQADHSMHSTIAAIDEALTSFSTLNLGAIRILKRFTKTASYRENQKSRLLGRPPFEELVVPKPMGTDNVASLFQAIRRFLALGPCSSTTVRNKSSLSSAHQSLERGLNSLYTTNTSNIFSFHHCVQTLFAISQLPLAEEFSKHANLERSMKLLTADRLKQLQRSNKQTQSAFKEVIRLIDSRIISAERCIDMIMRKGTKLGIMIPARTSGVLYSHRHDKCTLIRYSRHSYIRNQAKRLRQSNEVYRYTRKYVVEPEPDYDGTK